MYFNEQVFGCSYVQYRGHALAYRSYTTIASCVHIAIQRAPEVYSIGSNSVNCANRFLLLCVVADEWGMINRACSSKWLLHHLHKVLDTSTFPAIGMWKLGTSFGCDPTWFSRSTPKLVSSTNYFQQWKDQHGPRSIAGPKKQKRELGNTEITSLVLTVSKLTSISAGTVANLIERCYISQSRVQMISS